MGSRDGTGFRVCMNLLAAILGVVGVVVFGLQHGYGQNRSQGFEQQSLNPVHQAYLYASQAAQQKSGQQIKLGTSGVTGKDQDLRMGNTKMEERFCRSEKQTASDHQSISDQRPDREPPSHPTLLGQAVPSMLLAPESRQNLQNMTNNQIAAAAQIQSSMLVQDKGSESIPSDQSPTLPVLNPLVTSPQVANESSVPANSSSDVSGQSGSFKARPTVSTSVPINQPCIVSTQLTDFCKRDMICPGENLLDIRKNKLQIEEVYGGLEELVGDDVQSMLFIPEGVISEILSLLPVKPLLRFRSVCKAWSSLIDSKFFIKLHLKKTKELQAHRKLFQQGFTSDIYTVDFDSIIRTNIADVVVVPHPPFGPVGLINSCDGLVCVHHPDGGDRLAIWNPSTRRQQILPGLDSGVLPNPDNRYSTTCHWLCGFGHDSLHDDYKVLVIKQSRSGVGTFTSQVYVYSLKANLWRKIKSLPYYLRYRMCPGAGVLVSGAVHFVVGESMQRICSFDLAREEYGIVSHPVHLPDFKYRNLYIETIAGCLSIMWMKEREYIDIWVLEEYGNQESWIIKARVKASTYLRPLGVSGNQLLLEMRFDPNTMLLFDIVSESSHDVVTLVEREWGCYSSLPCHESLVQLTESRDVSLPQVSGRYLKFHFNY